jgi:hypothetical protein
VWPVFASHGATIFLKSSTALPTAPDTYVISAANALDATNAIADAATVVLKNEVILFLPSDFPEKFRKQSRLTETFRKYG